MATNPNRLARLPRIGDGKISFIPGDQDHNGWLLLSETTRMIGKVQYAKLFAVLGTKYGGSAASTTFGLPPGGDRFLLMAGQKYPLAATGGAEKVALTAPQMPKHSHDEVKASVAQTPVQKALLATTLLGISTGDITKPPTASVSTGATGEAGGGEAHDNMPPYMAVSVFIYAGMPAQT
ncbi:microcystin-dependent protein [Neorhizobium huautlense]|uniref:Microcystin-dependent protein n=1 Tax=Neorhizobium huautlense TaxID=67774 RepID=A0ABT9PT39_9HYPH|nr:tail fiber protein [Neorhizobium huautlense]MDP9837616.1 microcystin-dependent protein [Neorhizobium huautlense]